MRIIAACILAVTLGLPASNALPVDWVPSPGPSPLVGVGYTHDDGGALIVICDTSKKLMSFALKEPRASWHKGDTMKVQTRADDGTQMQPSTGQVIGPQEIVVGEEFNVGPFRHGQGHDFLFYGRRRLCTRVAGVEFQTGDDTSPRSVWRSLVTADRYRGSFFRAAQRRISRRIVELLGTGL